MNTPINNPNGIPGHGPSTQVSDPSAGRTDPRGIGVSGQDRDLLGANASELSRQPGTGPTSSKPQSEFSAFLDDLSQLVRSQGSSSSAGPSSSGSSGSGSDLRSEIERRVAQAREKMSGALGSAQDAGAAVTDRMRRGLDQSTDMLAERPLQAITIAAAVGLLVGLLLADRR